MIRTQIYLTKEQRTKIRHLGKPMAEFVREAVDARLSDADRRSEDREKAIRAAAGSWKDRDFTGDQYQVRMRQRRKN